MKTNIDHQEKNNLYKCHFCHENIDVYGIEKHFATFHQFRNSSKSEYICEFCDDFEEFNSQTNLFHHIQNTHNLTKVVTLEEGKSRFLQLIVDFNSHEDIFNFLQWIKHNDMSRFLANHPEIDNQFSTFEDNLGETNEEEDIDNTDSNSVVDFDQENDVILTQRETNKTIHKVTKNQPLNVKENISEMNEDKDEEFLHKDMDIADSNLIKDLDQEPDLTLIQRDISQGQESSDEEIFEEDLYQKNYYHSMNESPIAMFECKECKKTFSTTQALEQHIHTIHDVFEDHKCESCGKSFSEFQDLKKHTCFGGLKKYRVGNSKIQKGHNDYKYASCEKSYAQAGNLKKHIHSVHEGSKDHKCESCGKSFSRKDSLKLHIHTVHQGHKDYKCESCGHSFAQPGSLKTHIHTVHEGQDYKCESCRKSFSTPKYLKQHVGRCNS